MFNPHKRLTAEQALRHPYVAQFHNLADEPVCNRIIVLPISDNTKYTVSEYRCGGGGSVGGEVQGLKAAGWMGLAVLACLAVIRSRWPTASTAPAQLLMPWLTSPPTHRPTHPNLAVLRCLLLPVRERLYGEILKKKKEVVRQMREREAAMAAARAASSTPVPGGGGSSSGAYHGHGGAGHRTSMDNAARRRSLDNPNGAAGGRTSTTNTHYSSTGAYGAVRR